MASKMIAIKEDAYDRLMQLKTGDKSFSDVILDLTEKKKSDISEFFGIWSKEEADRVMKEVNRSRKKVDIELKKRAKRFGLE